MEVTIRRVEFYEINQVVSLQKEIEHLKEQAKVKDKQIEQLSNQADNLHKLLYI